MFPPKDTAPMNLHPPWKSTSWTGIELANLGTVAWRTTTVPPKRPLTNKDISLVYVVLALIVLQSKRQSKSLFLLFKVDQAFPSYTFFKRDFVGIVIWLKLHSIFNCTLLLVSWCLLFRPGHWENCSSNPILRSNLLIYILLSKFLKSVLCFSWMQLLEVKDAYT